MSRQFVEIIRFDLTLINCKMKYLLASVCILLVLYIISIPNVAANGRENNLNFGGYPKKLLRRERNTTSTLTSAKIGNFLLKQMSTNRHTSLREERFETRINHFSTDDLRTVEFKYILRDEYFHSDNGPIFIYINDGGIFTTQFLETGLMHDIAIDLHAALVTADMRYFRSNLPTSDASLSNLEFLTVEQCIADISMLINAVKLRLNSRESKIILWGSDHGASLATWAKREFPNLIDGVWSSSGIYERTVISHAPYESLSRTIQEIGGAECAATIERALDDFEYLSRMYYWWDVMEILDLCNFVFVSYDEDVALASQGLIELIHRYLDIHHFHGIKNLCNDIQVDDQDDAFEAFGRWVQHVYTDQSCYDLDYVARQWQSQQVEWEFFEEFAWNSSFDRSFPFDIRSQWYQKCTQLGLFPTTVNGQTLFGRLIQQEYYYLFCSRAFYDGSYDYLELEDAVNALNERYGAKNPGVEDIIFTNGVLDPYFSFGITEYSNNNSYVFNIPHYSKSADLFSESQFDATALRDVKRNIRSIITEWVQRES